VDAHHRRSRYCGWWACLCTGWWLVAAQGNVLIQKLHMREHSGGLSQWCSGRLACFGEKIALIGMIDDHFSCGVNIIIMPV